MTFKPRELTPGWTVRCIKNATKLSLRNPIAWLCIYILPLVVSEFVNSAPLLMLIAGIVIIAGTVLAFKADALSQDPIYEIIIRLSSVGYVFLVATIAIWVISWISQHSPNGMLISGQDVPLFGRFSVGFMFIIMGVAVVTLVAGMISSTFKIASILSSSKPLELHAVGMFSLHLTIDQGVGMFLAGRLSSEATLLNVEKFFVLVILFIVSTVVPPLVGLLIPFMYCLYRELFWGTGLTEPHAAINHIATPREVNAS
jgi:hypothetical protein